MPILRVRSQKLKLAWHARVDEYKIVALVPNESYLRVLKKHTKKTCSTISNDDFIVNLPKL